MKRDFLKDLGLEKDVIDQIMAANGEDIENARKAEQKAWEAEKEQLSTQISQFETQAAKRDVDLKKLQDKLTAKENDDVKLADAQKALEDFQAQYENDKKTWEAQSKQQAYEFAVKTKAGALKFSSNAAQKEFTREAIAAGLKMDGDDLLGWDDYVAKVKEADPAAFASEDPAPADPGPAPAAIVAPTTGGSSGAGNPFSFNFTKV